MAQVNLKLFCSGVIALVMLFVGTVSAAQPSFQTKAKQAFLNRDEAAKLGFSIPPEIADPPQKGAGGQSPTASRRPKFDAK